MRVLVICGTACALVAFACVAWVWTGHFGHKVSPIAAALIVASNAVLGAAVATEVVRRRSGWRSVAFWTLLLLTAAAGILVWTSWHLIL